VCNEDVAQGFYTNIHNSMKHDAILIQSMAHMNTQKTINEKYFHIVNEHQAHSIGFMNGSSRDTYVIMRLSKKEMSKNGNLRQSHHLVNIVVESERFFENDATSELAKMINYVRNEQQKEKK
jgi:hypothetical protein